MYGFYALSTPFGDFILIPTQHVKLQNGSTATNQFLVSSAPLYVKYYFFNVTNPEEVLNGAVPHVEEYGPCVYRYDVTV